MDQFEREFTENGIEGEEICHIGDHRLATQMIMGQESVQKNGSLTHKPSMVDNDLAVGRVLHFFPRPNIGKICS